MAGFGKKLTANLFRTASPPLRSKQEEDERVAAYLAKWLNATSTSISMGGLKLTRFPLLLLRSSTLQELLLPKNQIQSFPVLTEESPSPSPAVKRRTLRFGKSGLSFASRTDERRKSAAPAKKKDDMDSIAAIGALADGASGDAAEIDVSIIGYNLLATSLTRLSLAHNRITGADPGLQEALKVFSAKLKDFDISFNPIVDSDAFLAFIADTLVTLECLNIAGISLEDTPGSSMKGKEESVTMRTSNWVSHVQQKDKERKEEEQAAQAAMSCLSLDEPETQKVVTNHEEEDDAVLDILDSLIAKAEAEEEAGDEEAEKGSGDQPLSARKTAEIGTEENVKATVSPRGGGGDGETVQKVEKETKEDEREEDREVTDSKEADPALVAEPESQKKPKRKKSRKDEVTEEVAAGIEAAKRSRKAGKGSSVKRKKSRKAEEDEPDTRTMTEARRPSSSFSAVLQPCTSALCRITCGEKTTDGMQKAGHEDTAAELRKRAKSEAAKEEETQVGGVSRVKNASRAKRRSHSSSTEFLATKFQRNLKQLNLAKCSLTAFPSHLAKLAALTSLDLSYNYIGQLPEEIGLLPHLKFLTVIACSCTSLPKGLGKLRELEELYLDFNAIEYFPEEAAAGMVSLRQLFMPNNNLHAIPTCIVDFATGFCLPHLEFCDLNGNPIVMEDVIDTPLEGQPWAKIGPPPDAPEGAEAAIVRFTSPLESKLPSCILEKDEQLGGLFLGCGLCAQNKHGLRHLGVASVLTVARGMSPPYPVEFDYMNIEVDDAETENLAPHLEKCIAFIEEARTRGGVMVHCSAGVSRSSSVVIAYLMQKLGMSFEVAHQHVLDRREIIKPNPSFVRQLQLFEKALNSNSGACVIS